MEHLRYLLFKKCLHFLLGLAQNSGIYEAKGRKALEDGVCTALYRKAGAIPMVVTNVPEFCSWWETNNVSYGRTFNPYSRVRIAGGSSGNCDLNMYNY